MKKYLLFLPFIFSSCQLISPDPEPTVSFTSKSGTNGAYTFNSSAANVDSYQWDFGDGESSTEKIPTHVYVKNGQYSVTLTGKGKGGSKSVSEKITVDNILGSIIFWMQATRNKIIEVKVNGVYKGDITGFYSTGVPTCGSKYCVTVSGLKEGTYTYEAKEAGSLIPSTWSNTFTVTGGSCTQRKLTY